MREGKLKKKKETKKTWTLKLCKFIRQTGRLGYIVSCYVICLFCLLLFQFNSAACWRYKVAWVSVVLGVCKVASADHWPPVWVQAEKSKGEASEWLWMIETADSVALITHSDKLKTKNITWLALIPPPEVGVVDTSSSKRPGRRRRRRRRPSA